MKAFNSLCLLLVLCTFATGVWSADTTAVATKNDTSAAAKKKDTPKKKKKPKEPKFEDLIEDFEKIEGLFTFYQNVKEGKVYLEIRQDQFGTVYLCNITRQSGDAFFFDSGAMLDEFPFFIKRVGKKIQFIRKNVAFRASSDAAISRALKNGISHSIWGSAKIASQPHPERGSVLVDPTSLFVQDYTGVGQITGRAKINYSLDKNNSSFSQIKSFPLNSEVEVSLHFKTGKPSPSFTLADSRSMFHRYHYSLSALPETDYQPRIADDRVGHFLSMYQDYTSVLEDTPYKRFITRWHLEKAEPRFELSKPKQPIVFWLENTIPVEYRDAVREGILLWNRAFEKIGFKDAIEVRQMPDDADWDPADVRYNTVRWIVQPGGGYAVGPSRANPFTGQIYDADIRVSADFVRFYYREFGEVITPISWVNFPVDRLWPDEETGLPGEPGSLNGMCNFSDGLTRQMAFGWSLLSARGTVSQKDLKQFIHDGIVDLIVHEVGHTLGLRHNFKASSTIPMDDLSDENFTQQEGISGSVMDYNAINIQLKGNKQGAYFQTTLGAYDYWAIEYAYKPLPPDGKKSEKEMLEEIAQRVAEPRLQYGTDEDAFGFSTRGMDPMCNLFDLGGDPLGYYKQRIQLARELWEELPEKFERKGERYQKFRKVFGQGINEYALAAATVPKFIGGIYSYRDHIGDPDGRVPFRVVPAETQRRALRFLIDEIFAPDALQFSPDLLNKLAAERFWDFEGKVFRMSRIDYPVHGIVMLIQASALYRLFDPLVIQRVQDNEIRFPKGESVFTMAELFHKLRNGVWQELDNGNNINSFRRELQRMHLFLLNKIVVESPKSLPHDAITLARADLTTLQDKITRRLDAGNLDDYTRAHLQETAAKIAAALKLQFRADY